MLAAKPYTRISWAEGMGRDGRPKLISGLDPSEGGTVSCPSMGGGTTGRPPPTVRARILIYFISTEGCRIYY
jgi:hypothetical protein